MHIMSAILFKTGETVLSPDAQDLLERNCQSAREYLLRHARGDWGEDIPDELAESNQRAVTEGGKLVSQYWVGVERLHVVTSSDRKVTKLLLPSENFSEEE